MNCFCCTERLGDCILGTIVFRKLLKETNEEWAWASAVPYLSVAREFTNNLVGVSTDQGAARKTLDAQFDKVLYTTPWWYWSEWGEGRILLLDLIAKKANIKLEPEDRQVVLTPNEEDIKVVDQLLNGLNDYIVVFGSPHYSGWGGHDWPFPERISLIQTLEAEGHKVVVIGGNDTRKIGGINLGGKTTYHQTVEIIKRAKLFVGQTTAGAWLAAAAHDTPKIIMVDKSKKPGREGHEDCLNDDNIIDLSMTDSFIKVLEVVKEKGWL